MKPQVRVLTVSDGKRARHDSRWFIGTIFRGSKYFEGLIKFIFEPSQERLVEKISLGIQQSRHHCQVRLILLDGLQALQNSLSDIEQIYQRTGIPVIVLERKKARTLKKNMLREKTRELETRPLEEESISSIEYRSFRLYYTGIKLKDVMDFIQFHIKNGKTPSILNSTRVIANAYNLFKGKQKGQL
ncbi:endonuclease dU [[Eubacterium] cellulosolvens]